MNSTIQPELHPINDAPTGAGELPQAPHTRHGAVEVTFQEFYKAIGVKNAIGSIINSYERKGRGYVTEMRDGPGANAPLLGIRESGDFPFTPKRFFLVKNGR